MSEQSEDDFLPFELRNKHLLFLSGCPGWVQLFSIWFFPFLFLPTLLNWFLSSFFLVFVKLLLFLFLFHYFIPTFLDKLSSFWLFVLISFFPSRSPMLLIIPIFSSIFKMSFLFLTLSKFIIAKFLCFRLLPYNILLICLF